MDITFEKADPFSLEKQKWDVQNIILSCVLPFHIKDYVAAYKAKEFFIDYFFTSVIFPVGLTAVMSVMIFVFAPVLGMRSLCIMVACFIVLLWFAHEQTNNNNVVFMLSDGLLSDAFIVLSGVSMPIVSMCSLMDVIKLVLGGRVGGRAGKNADKINSKH